MLIYGYFSTKPLKACISEARLPRQTSRILPLALPLPSVLIRPSSCACCCCSAAPWAKPICAAWLASPLPPPPPFRPPPLRPVANALFPAASVKGFGLELMLLGAKPGWASEGGGRLLEAEVCPE